jgi:hypothetical protein
MGQATFSRLSEGPFNNLRELAVVVSIASAKSIVSGKDNNETGQHILKAIAEIPSPRLREGFTNELNRLLRG